MFTGIIEQTTEVVARQGHALGVARPHDWEDVNIGESIAVHGVCLTVTALTDDAMHFDVADTTLGRTTLGALNKGDRVHLERALPLGGRLDGHIVQGHVDAIAEIVDVEERDGERRLTIRAPQDLRRFIAPRGSVTLDGVALTVADVHGDVFTVAVIPHTASTTTLGQAARGAHVNIETDVIARYVHSLLPHVG